MTEPKRTSSTGGALEPIERPPLPSLVQVVGGVVVVVVVGLIAVSLIRRLVGFLIGLAITVAIIGAIGYGIVAFAKSRSRKRKAKRAS